jgi:hypothetical protein
MYFECFICNGITGLYRLIITSINNQFRLIFKTPPNQKEDAKLLCSDWLFRILQENFTWS